MRFLMTLWKELREGKQQRRDCLYAYAKVYLKMEFSRLNVSENIRPSAHIIEKINCLLKYSSTMSPQNTRVEVALEWFWSFVKALLTTSASRRPPPKKATDSACVRSREWAYRNFPSSSFVAACSTMKSVPLRTPRCGHEYYKRRKKAIYVSKTSSFPYAGCANQIDPYPAIM